MLEYIDYDAQTLNASEQSHWYWRLWTCCLGYGCLDYQVDEYPASLIPYEPVGQFQRAASMGDLSTVEHFITSRRYHVDKYDRRNRTSLHYACAHNHPEVVTLLIKNNCNINVQDDEGCTPLIKATERNNLECVSILLKHGADPHMADFTGNTALHYAVYNGNKAIASELLEYKVDINATTKHGVTPFSLAVFEKKEKIAEFLRERGANEHEVIESNSETSLGEESSSMLNYDAQINTEVHYSTNPKPFCSEVRHPGQLKPILKKPNQISTEVDNNTEEKSLSRLPDKPDPDILGPTKEDNDSISIIKKISIDPEMNINNIECISVKTSSRILHQSKPVRRRVENRVRKLLRRCEASVFSQGVPLPVTSEEETPIKNLSPDSAIEMLDRESVPLRLPPEDNSDDMLLVQKNTQGDSHIKKETTKMPPSEVSNEEKWAQLVATQYSFLSQYLKERLKEKMKEGSENSESDASDEEPVPSTSAGRTHLMQKMSLNQKARTNSDREYASTQSKDLCAKRSEEEEWAQLSALQYAHINKLLRQDLKKKICKMYENSENNVCSNKAPIPEKLKQRKHFKKMTEKRKKHERKDAYMYSRHSSVKRKEDRKEQADWHLERLKELLKNDIKEMLKEQLTTEHARMRKLLRKDVKKISELIRNELRQICIEQMALLQAQVKETQEEQVNLQYLQLKDHFRRVLKEVVHEHIKKSKIILCPNEKPLLGTSKRTADLQRTSLQQKVKKKYEGDHDSSLLHSEEPLMQTDEGRQNDSHCMLVNKFIKEELKEAFCEIFERNKYDTCLKKELPHISKERKQLRKVSQEEEIEKEHNVEYASFWSQPSMRTDEATVGEQNAQQYKHLKEYLQKDLKEMICEQFENSEVILYPKEELPSDDSRRVMHIKVEEKKTGYVYVPHFSSFEHRIAALRATTHIEPDPAACTGGAGDMGAMDKAQKAELALPLALALQTEHPRGQQHINPEPAPEHCSYETIDPDHNADFALDSCLLAQSKADRLSSDSESAPLCASCDMEDPANDADLDVHAAYSTDHSIQSINTNTRPALLHSRGDTTDHDNGTDLGSALPVVVD
ncbi:ankyrin repeat domain-containing protein 20A3-like isoform X3 [Mastomys coucha]|uniref:ankyrin repeat domain-containing protein 20A3-like isoform X3 n=1 Tax=Mastomys coucha TaxID=35658 RepID=UPI0012624877|nr:ankyrin repeat domain-containing protein 20A3-like isoform X3 [Mastomys coucha]